MRDENFSELLGDDGEFLEALDTDYGVYSVHPHSFWRRIYTAIFTLTMSGLIIYVCFIH